MRSRGRPCLVEEEESLGPIRREEFRKLINHQVIRQQFVDRLCVGFSKAQNEPCPHKRYPRTIDELLVVCWCHAVRPSARVLPRRAHRIKGHPLERIDPQHLEGSFHSNPLFASAIARPFILYVQDSPSRVTPLPDSRLELKSAWEKQLFFRHFNASFCTPSMSEISPHSLPCELAQHTGPAQPTERQTPGSIA
jgi:hypothetical protein